jgi:hypothetical protein
MQDLLPDYASASLDATAAASVEQHLLICDPCRDDITLLRRARAIRPTAVPVDIARIVAGLPRPTPTLRLVRSSHDQSLVGAAATSNARPRRRWSASVWQVAAAVGVMVVGGTSLLVSRNSPVSLTGARSNEAQLAEAAESTLARTGGSVAALDSPASIGRALRESRVSVSYGDLGDYSEAELQRMLDRLEQWDGTSSTEPLPTLPVVSNSGGSAP